MTAPQHTAETEAMQLSSQSMKNHSLSSKTLSYYRLQRCLFVSVGWIGCFGFVASQLSLAYAESEFLINDYVASSESSVPAANYSVADTTFALSEPAFEPSAQPAPEAFVDAPVSTEAAIEAFSVSSAPSFVAPEPLPAAPVSITPEPLPAPVSITPEVVPAAPVVAPEAVNSSATAPVAAKLAPPAAEMSAASAQPLLAEPAAKPVVPVVADAPQSRFTFVRKPTNTKPMASRGRPSSNLMESSAVATPVSAYASGPVAMATTVVDAAGGAPIDAPAVEMPVIEESAPIVDAAPAAIPDIAPEPLPAPAVIAPPEPVAELEPVGPTELVPAALPEGISLPDEYNSVFVDPTDYSVGATESPDVVISEQSTGCEFTVGQGQGVPDGACGVPAAPAPVTVAGPQTPNAPVAAAPAVAPVPVEVAPVASAPAVNVGPVSFSAEGIRFSNSTTAAGREYLNRSVRPIVNLQAGENFIFPLSVPSPITSLFGFRLHPITGNQRFHAGTDIGASQGTPVLAAQDGVVVSADYAGGYGLMVTLQHEVDGTLLETRYAHLSDITVDPGTEVKKGNVIGLVGSTGNSTGPHLHFEMLQMTAEGWVPVNADGLVQASLARFIGALNNPLQAFNLSELNVSALSSPVRATTNIGELTLPKAQVLPGRDGIPFRPAQPNAS